jgi:TRAP-type C4-dicarboxylate transport system substrate-binding protein
MKKLLGSTLFAAALGLMSPVHAQTQLNVVAPWSNLNAYEAVEKPFWAEKLPQLTDDKLSAKLSNYSELGLAGAELLRLATMGVFDVAHIVVGYSVSDDPVIEGLELAGLIQDIETGRKALDAYRPVMAKSLEAKNLVLLGVYPNPSQVLYCREPINSIADFANKKVRFYGASMNEFIEAAGGTGVSVPLAEVVPALQRGVVDCGITGTLTGYSFKWPEVTSNLFGMRFGWGLTLIAANSNSFAALSEEERESLVSAVSQLETELWDLTAIDDQAGIDCNSGLAECPYGTSASMTYVAPSAEDDAERERILEEVVLKKWAARCTQECVDDWNATIGQALGLTASK